MKNNPELRTEPKSGDIIAVPLGRDEWAYLCHINMCKCYVYRFVSKGLLSGDDPSFFGKDPWMTVLRVFEMPTTFATIGRRKLAGPELMPPVVSKDSRLREFCAEYGHPETDWWLHVGPDTRPITAQEAKNYPNMWLRTAAADFAKFLKSYRVKMPVVKGEKGAVPPPAPPEDPREVTFLIESNGLKVLGSNDLFDAMVVELEDRAVEYDTEGETVTVDRNDSTEALICIRRGLKRIVPKHEWPCVQIVKFGPKIGQEQVFALEAQPRKDPRDAVKTPRASASFDKDGIDPGTFAPLELQYLSDDDGGPDVRLSLRDLDALCETAEADFELSGNDLGDIVDTIIEQKGLVRSAGIDSKPAWFNNCEGDELLYHFAALDDALRVAAHLAGIFNSKRALRNLLRTHDVPFSVD